MHIRPKLHPICRDGAIFLPAACYMLNHSEKVILCQFLSSVKLLDRYASNISGCVSLKDNKITSLKSHNCHMLMQCLLPITLRAYLQNIGDGCVRATRS